MQFKDPNLQDELAKTPTMLQVIAEWFCQLSINYFSIDPLVTRVFETVDGSSGVHEAHRAVDFRDQHDGTFLYKPEQVLFLLSEMNRRFPRSDRKMTMIHHSFNNGPFHFHCQVAPNSNTTIDLGDDLDCHEIKS